MTVVRERETVRRGRGLRFAHLTAHLQPIKPGQSASPPGGNAAGRIALLVAWIARELRVYWAISQDSRTPTRSKLFLWAAVGYAVWPLGLVPDFIPVVGYIDDLIIVPTLIFVAVRAVPPEVAKEARDGTK